MSEAIMKSKTPLNEFDTQMSRFAGFNRVEVFLSSQGLANKN